MPLSDESSLSVQHCRTPRISRTGTPAQTTGVLVLLHGEPDKDNKTLFSHFIAEKVKQLPLHHIAPAQDNAKTLTVLEIREFVCLFQDCCIFAVRARLRDRYSLKL